MSLEMYNTWGRYAGIGAPGPDFRGGPPILGPKTAFRGKNDFLLVGDMLIAYGVFRPLEVGVPPAVQHTPVEFEFAIRR